MATMLENHDATSICDLFGYQTTANSNYIFKIYKHPEPRPLSIPVTEAVTGGSSLKNSPTHRVIVLKSRSKIPYYTFHITDKALSYLLMSTSFSVFDELEWFDMEYSKRMIIKRGHNGDIYLAIGTGR